MYFYTHPDCLLHDPEPAPGFAPARIRQVAQALGTASGLALTPKTAAPARPDEIECIHCADYVQKVLAPIPEGENVAFDFETNAMSGTARAALAASGLALHAFQAVRRGQTRHAFCAASPGGHHAEADNASGFCFFNHIALAAVTAIKARSDLRLAVLDFDAHHGNGTQSFFWGRTQLLYVSLHEDLGLSGFADERGAWDNVLNLPLPSHSVGTVFRGAMETEALPKIEAFAPDMLLLSAGFDMHRDDPLSSLQLETSDYGWLGKTLKENLSCPFLSVLEGGYNLSALAESAVAFCQGLES